VRNELTTRPVLLHFSDKTFPKGHMVLLLKTDGGGFLANDPGGYVYRYGIQRHFDVSSDVIPYSAHRFNGQLLQNTPLSVMIQIQLRGRSDNSTELEVEFTNPASDWNKRVSLHADQAGRATTTLTDVPHGNVDIIVRAPYRLSTKISKRLTLGTNSLDFGPLPGGDFNRDDVINALDASLFLADAPSGARRSDLNGDGRVNGIDWALFVQNYGARGSGPTGKPRSLSLVASSSGGVYVGTVSVWPDKANATVGDTVSVRLPLNTDGATLDAANVLLHYDPGVLEYIGFEQGPAFATTVASPHANGLVELAGSSGPQGQPLKGNGGMLGTVRFKVIASMPDTTITAEFKYGDTPDSNLSEQNSASDVLALAQPGMIRLSGSPTRQMPFGQIISPANETTADRGELALVAEASDPYGQLKRVRFEVNTGSSWESAGIDENGADGWSVKWNPLTPRIWAPAHAPSPFFVRAFLMISDDPTVGALTPEAKVYMADDDYIFGHLIVSPKPGADIYAIVARHGGARNDVVSNDRCQTGCYYVETPRAISAMSGFQLLDEYDADPEVEDVFLDKIWYSVPPFGSPPALDLGWNLIAPSWLSGPAPVKDALSPLAESFDAAYAYTPENPADPWQFYGPEAYPSANNLTWVRPDTGLWVHFTHPSGLPRGSGEQANLVEGAIPGWNLLGFVGPQATAITQTLKLSGRRVTRVFGHDGPRADHRWQSFTPASGVPGDLLGVWPGRAYWVEVGSSFASGQKSGGKTSAPSAGAMDNPSVPPIPMTIWGAVTVHGPLPPNPDLTAWAGTKLLATTRLTVESSFALHLAGDIPDTSVVEGAAESERITFRLGAEPLNEYVIWRSGQIGEADLTLGTNAVPTPTMEAEPTPTSRATPPVPVERAYLPLVGNQFFIQCQAAWSGIDDPQPINDRPENAIVLCPGEDYHGRLWRGDGWDFEDNYRIVMPRSGNMRASLKVPPASAGDYDLSLYRRLDDGTNQLIRCGCQPAGVDEVLEVTGLEAGHYSLGILAKELPIEAPYRLSWTGP
jgi:hypothetical protein